MIATDGAGLLRAILDDPHDDVPRLVYADWLEEHGDETERVRAEFIRVQIELDEARRECCCLDCAGGQPRVIDRKSVV